MNAAGRRKTVFGAAALDASFSAGEPLATGAPGSAPKEGLRRGTGGTSLSAKAVFEQASMGSFLAINVNGPAMAQLRAERLATDGRQRRQLSAPEPKEMDGSGSEEARFIQAYERGCASNTRFASRLELRLQLVNLSLTLCFSRRSFEIVSAATQLLTLLDADPSARRELLSLSQVEGIDRSAILTNTIATLMGVCGRMRSSTGKKDSQLDVYLLAVRLVSDLRLALQLEHAPAAADGGDRTSRAK
jgi:hypothetical protein